MQNRTPIAKEARARLYAGAAQVPARRVDARAAGDRVAASPTPCFRGRWGDKFDNFRARTGADAGERAARGGGVGRRVGGGGWGVILRVASPRGGQEPGGRGTAAGGRGHLVV